MLSQLLQLTLLHRKKWRKQQVKMNSSFYLKFLIGVFNRTLSIHMFYLVILFRNFGPLVFRFSAYWFRPSDSDPNERAYLEVKLVEGTFLSEMLLERESCRSSITTISMVPTCHQCPGGWTAILCQVAPAVPSVKVKKSKFLFFQIGCLRVHIFGMAAVAIPLQRGMVFTKITIP